MASAKEIKQLVDGIGKLKGRGSFRDLFDKYDSDGDGLIDRKELTKLLKKADIGNSFTRGVWTSGVLQAADEQQSGTADEKVSWAEFQSLIGGRVNAMLRGKLTRMFQVA